MARSKLSETLIGSEVERASMIFLGSPEIFA